MIRRIQFSNFCSFLEETAVDFTTTLKTSTDDSFVTSNFDDQVALLTGVFGPNAAGKTNLLKALSFVSFFMRSSYRSLEPGEAIPVDRFAGVDRDEEPARFELEFDGGAGRFRYAVVLCSNRVHEESLKQYSKKTRQFRQVLTRKLITDGKLHLRTADNFTEVALLKEVLSDRPNASMLAAGLQTGRKEFKQVLEALGSVVTNVTRGGKREQPFEGLTTDLFECSEFFQQHPEHHDALRELLTAADIGISDFEIKPVRIQRTNGNGEAHETFLVFFVHDGPQGSFELAADKESSGTRRLFMLFETFIKILCSGGIAVIDEMESDLHPHLIPTILSLFTNPEINRSQAQLFFTCHHIEMLNHLLKEQIYLVEKNADCVSEAFRLDALKGVRREENFFANYNSGRYGAIPQPEVVAF
jgi:predicted ATPase